jgi:hypothetical protein
MIPSIVSACLLGLMGICFAAQSSLDDISSQITQFSKQGGNPGFSASAQSGCELAVSSSLYQFPEYAYFATI